MLAYTIAAIVFLLAISAFFSAAETALTAVSRGRMHQLEKDGSKAAAHVNRLVANRERMIGAVLLGNTFINILTSSLATATLAFSPPRLRPAAVAVPPPPKVEPASKPVLPAVVPATVAG